MIPVELTRSGIALTHRLRKYLLGVRRLAFVLFALAQLMPPGLALASDGDGFTFVICTIDGPQTVSWEEMTGEPSPFGVPSEQDSNAPCHACVTSCRAGAGVTPNLDPHIANARSIANAALPVAFAAPLIRATRPPMPSRAPPAV